MDENSRKATKIPEKLFAELGHLPGALLPVLHAVQAYFGYIPEDSVPEQAEVQYKRTRMMI